MRTQESRDFNNQQTSKKKQAATGVERDLTNERLALYEAIFANSIDGIAIIDAQGNYIRQNHAHRSLLGYEDEELRGKTPAIHLGDEAFALIAQELAATGAYRGELESRPKAGQPMTIELSAFAVRDEAGEPVCFVGIKRDVTERKQVEHQLRERINQLQTIYQLTDAVSRAEEIEDIYQVALDALQRALKIERASILLFDSDGVMRFKAWRGLSDEYRKAVAGHTPWSPDEKNPRPVLVPNVEQEESLAALRETILGEGIRAMGFIPLVYKCRLLGKFMIYYAAPHLFTEEEIQIVQTIASHVAIAIERKQSEDALRRSEQFNKQIIESSSDCIKVLDTEGRLLFMSAGGQLKMGITDISSLIGQSWVDFWSGDDRQAAREAIEQAKVGGVGRFRGFCPTAMGTPRWWDVIVTPIRDDSGRVERLLSISRDVTEQRQIEEALRRSEQELSDFFENAPIGLHWVGPDGSILRVNKAELDLLGYTRDEYLNRNIADFHADKDTVDDILHRLSCAETLQDYEARLVCKDGAIKHVLISSNVLWENGRFVHTRCFTRDVTERRLVAALLDGQKRVLELIAQGAPLPAVLEVLTRAIEEQSSANALASILLLDRDGVHLRHGAAPSLPASYNEAIDGIAIGPSVGSCGTAAYLSKQVIVTDIATDPLWADFRELALEHGLRACWSTPIFSTEGKVLGTFAMYYREPRAPSEQDLQLISMVTRTAAIAIERKRTEEDLQNQQKWLEAVLNLMPTPMLLIEPGTARVTFANKAADEMAGGDFPKGKPAEEYHTVYYCTDGEGNRIPDEEMPGVRAARGERLNGFQMEWHTPAGKRWLILYADTLPAMHGHPATCVVMFQDITAIKQIEAELQKANRAKDEFLATVSHEVRTPLNAILGWARMLRTGKLDEQMEARALETIERNAKAQAQLIEDLLDVSRIITGKLRLDVRPVELATVIEAATDAVRPAADAKNIRLDVALDYGTGPVSGDPDRLQQVVWNLLSNAIKFTPSGGRVSVRLEQKGAYARISVSDTGRGIKPEFMPYLFDRFTQADSSLTRKHGGLGLGLAIVRHLVELHGGRIRATSEGEGKGATFEITLPLAMAQDQLLFLKSDTIIELPAEPIESLFDSKIKMNGLRVLVVDDDTDARELVKTALTQCGAEVKAVSSAAEALEALVTFKADVLVSDIEMPGEDGYSLIRKVREQGDGASRIAAAALTAHARVEDRLRALSAGFDTHVAKPVEPSELIAVVASIARRIAKA